MAVVNRELVPVGYDIIRNWNDANYYYVPGDINTRLTVPADIIQQDITIVVCTSYEAHCEIVEKIYRELVSDLSINPVRILLISENADLEPLIRTIAIEYETGLINYEWSLVFEQGTRIQTIKELDIGIKRVAYTNQSNKSFLNFNRRWRIHRPTLVALLYVKGLLSKGHVSLGKDDFENSNWIDKFEYITQVIASDEILYSLLISRKQEIVQLPEMYLDTSDLSINRDRLRYDDVDKCDTDNLYQDTYFSVVSETYFFEDIGRFLSEKTFKPIAYHHPFIIVGVAKSLELLRNLGYKTFHPFINESYDLETNNATRMRMILDEIERLSNMNEDEVAVFLKNTEHVTAHNFKHLVTNKKNIHKKF